MRNYFLTEIKVAELREMQDFLTVLEKNLAIWEARRYIYYILLSFWGDLNTLKEKRPRNPTELFVSKKINT